MAFKSTTGTTAGCEVATGGAGGGPLARGAELVLAVVLAAVRATGAAGVRVTTGAGRAAAVCVICLKLRVRVLAGAGVALVSLVAGVLLLVSVVAGAGSAVAGSACGDEAPGTVASGEVGCTC